MKIGIVGLGRMGKNHLRVLNSLKDRIDGISIYDTDFDTMTMMSKIYDVDFYVDMDKFLDSIDAAIICTPTTTHSKIAMKCAEKNKDILLEKPVTSTIKEAEELIEYLKNKDLICMVGHVERFNPAILYLMEYLKNKSIVSITANRISKIEKGRYFDVDVVTDLMIHDIDIVLAIIKNKPINLFAASCDENLNIATALFQFENKATANLSASRSSQEKIRELVISTADENIHLNYIESKLDFVKLCNDKISIGASSEYSLTGKKESLQFEGEPLKLELQHFIECVAQRKKPMSNEETAFVALLAAKEILDCISKGVN